MRSPLAKTRIAALAVLLVGAIAGVFASASFVPALAELPGFGAISRPYRLGLDLKGGTHLVYQADFSNFGGTSRAEAMAGLRDVIERRVNLFGVAEPLVQVEESGDEYRLIVELAGVRDIAEAIRTIGETPFLEFREARSAEESEALLKLRGAGEALTSDPAFKPTELNGRYLKRAELGFDSTTNVPLINIEFTAEGAELFEAITARSVGKPLAIYLDGVPLSVPTVREAISGGRAQISGEFTASEARTLARRLASGALPVPITLIGQQSVGASLGEASLAQSLRAAIAGFLAVALFMLAWYRLPGLIAVVALVIYTALVLAAFKLIGVTLTAAAIAGFILSVGMAVDANILIFERLREELRSGKDLTAATAEGFSRAWTSIRDSNISTLITAAILYWLGTSIVEGFALTLGIGVVVSMFSAITASRLFLRSVASGSIARQRQLFASGWPHP